MLRARGWFRFGLRVQGCRADDGQRVDDLLAGRAVHFTQRGDCVLARGLQRAVEASRVLFDRHAQRPRGARCARPREMPTTALDCRFEVGLGRTARSRFVGQGHALRRLHGRYPENPGKTAKNR